MSEDSEFDGIAERLEFLKLVSAGTPRHNAAYEINWTPRRLRKELADANFLELVEDAEIRRDDSVEQILYELALKKQHFQAIQMILLNRRAEAWRDVKRIEIRTEGAVKVDVVHSVHAGLAAALKEGGDLRALQPGSTLLDEDGDALDVESHEDTDG